MHFDPLLQENYFLCYSFVEKDIFIQRGLIEMLGVWQIQARASFLADLTKAILYQIFIYIINFPTWIPDSNFCSSFFGFQAPDLNICSVLAFQPLRKSSHVVVSVFIDFPSNSKLNTPFRMFTILVLDGMVFLIVWEMLHKYTP